MNINEQMGQLGQIGSVGYTPTDTVVDQLVARTKRTRAFRQGTAALVGSIGAVGLGLLGAQVFVNLTSDQDAASIPIRDLAFNNMTFEELEGKDYTGLGKSPEELANAWKKVQEGATIVPAAPGLVTEEAAPATCAPQTKVKDGWVFILNNDTGCVWKKDHRDETVIPDGSFLFGNGHVYKCEQWTDAATGTTFWGAWSGTEWGWEKKMIQCDPNDKYWYEYRYMGNSATVSGHTCTGSAVNYLGAPHRISCRTYSALWALYPEWSGANGGNSRFTLNNEAGKILTDTNYKWFVSGSCIGSPAAVVKSAGFRQCHQANCDGGYYRTTDHPTAGGHTYSWNGSTWVQDPDPTPTVTPTVTPTPSPEPSN